MACVTSSSVTCSGAAELFERDQGCLLYVVGTCDEPDAVWVRRGSIRPHDASLEPDDIRALIQQARPLIAGMSN